LFNCQNNYVDRSSWLLEFQNFLQHYHQCLILHNYFDNKIIFSDLYLAKFLDISVKQFFPCTNVLTASDCVSKMHFHYLVEITPTTFSEINSLFWLFVKQEIILLGSRLRSRSHHKKQINDRIKILTHFYLAKMSLFLSIH